MPWRGVLQSAGVEELHERDGILIRGDVDPPGTGLMAPGAIPGLHPSTSDGRLRGLDGVWIADASILPSCPGVNPQLSIIALAAGFGWAAAAENAA